MELRSLSARARACVECAGDIPEPRPVFRVSSSARILIAGQAPGTRVHASGTPFTDPSGDRLRQWMGVDEDIFYDESRIAILPMGFCFPGLDAKGGDKPPRPICARIWRQAFMECMPNLSLVLMIGAYAMKWHGKDVWKGNVTSTVAHWKDAGATRLALPHPSWRNNAWIKKNPWFEKEVLPDLKTRVEALIQ